MTIFDSFQVEMTHKIPRVRFIDGSYSRYEALVGKEEWDGITTPYSINNT